MTHEHVLGQWLREIVPSMEGQFHTAFDGPLDTSSDDMYANVQTRHRQGHTRTVTARALCEPCNTGWSSCLEQKVKPLLLPMIRKAETDLDADQLKLLATWAAKTAMIAEHVRPKFSVVPQQVRDCFVKQMRPPPGCYVWLGLRDSPETNMALLSAVNFMSPTPPSNRDMKNIYSCAIVLGPVFLLVVYSTINKFVLKLEAQTRLQQIWPQERSTALWPLEQALTDELYAGAVNVLMSLGWWNHRQ